MANADIDEFKDRGFDAEKVTKAFRDFEKDIGDVVKANSNDWTKINDELLKDAPAEDIKAKTKGLFVGRLFMKQAKGEQNPYYLIATCKRFIIMIPTGAIQSFIHLLAIPKCALYNPVSMDPNHANLCLEMQAGLRKVVADILEPNSKPRKLYMRQLKTALATGPKERAHIRITHPKTNLDTDKLKPEEGVARISKALDDFYEALKKTGRDMLTVGCTDFHVHDSNSVGQAHLHGWLAYPDTITEMGTKLLYKNTPLDRVLPVMYEVRGFKDPKLKKPRAVVKEAVKTAAKDQK